jgi:hypothetical protein
MTNEIESDRNARTTCGSIQDGRNMHQIDLLGIQVSCSMDTMTRPTLTVRPYATTLFFSRWSLCDWSHFETTRFG